MSFVIHLHLGNTTESPAPIEAARAASPGRSEARRRSSHSRSTRWTSHREYEEHLRRFLGSLARASATASDEPPDDVIPLDDEDLWEVPDDATNQTDSCAPILPG